MNTNVRRDGMVKIGFKLERDEDGYPPADWEWMWASRVSNFTFKIDNIPFFAKLIACGDIVAAEQTADGLIFKELIQPSGHSTLRVIIHRGDQNDRQLQILVEKIRKILQEMGCSTELSHIPSLIAVDIPSELDYQSIAKFLMEKEDEGILGYEEACLASEI